MVSVLLRVAAGVVVVLALACAATPKTPAPRPQPEARLPSTPPPAFLFERRVRPRATEMGFTHCCGSEKYKLEIDCGDMMMRCYRRSGDGRWRFTYGRLCREHLGEGCYPSGCEDVCPLPGSR